jgi:hypothetical protein
MSFLPPVSSYCCLQSGLPHLPNLAPKSKYLFLKIYITPSALSKIEYKKMGKKMGDTMPINLISLAFVLAFESTEFGL